MKMHVCFTWITSWVDDNDPLVITSENTSSFLFPLAHLGQWEKTVINLCTHSVIGINVVDHRNLPQTRERSSRARWHNTLLGRPAVQSPQIMKTHHAEVDLSCLQRTAALQTTYQKSLQSRVAVDNLNNKFTVINLLVITKNWHLIDWTQLCEQDVPVV